MARNIKTHHAEDGSGVGSAIIAGMSIFQSLTTGLAKLKFECYSHDQGKKGRREICQLVMGSE